MTRAEILAALTDEQALVCTLQGEAAGEGLLGQLAVACVVRNRVGHRWGKTVKAVCLGRSQFSCWWGTNANTAAVFALAEALVTRQPICAPSLHSELRWIAAGVIADQLRDITRSADHYLTRSLFRGPNCPSWAKGQLPVAEIGNHCFFRLEI